MRHLDTDYVEEVIARIESIPEDAAPRWGTMRKAELIEHLVWVVRHSMGRSQQARHMGNWFTRYLIAPLVLHGIVPIPKNLKTPKKLAARGVTLREHGDLETLHALLEEYCNLVQADELRPALHPVFGDIGVDGWDRLHVRHFEHHLKQFGV